MLWSCQRFDKIRHWRVKYQLRIDRFFFFLGGFLFVLLYIYMYRASEIYSILKFSLQCSETDERFSVSIELTVLSRY